MKNFLSFIFIVLLSSQIFSQAGWYQQNSGVNYNLTHIARWNYDILCNNGKLLKISNGGFNWIEQSTPTNEKLNYMLQLSTLNYFLVGNNGVILKSTNTGANWFLLNSGINLNLNTAASVSGTTSKIYVFGDNGLILYSTNLGTNWIQQISGINVNLNSVIPYSNGGLTVVGDNGTIIKSTDYGNNWFTVTSNTSNNLNHIMFGYYPEGVLYAVGNNGTIIYSDDHGFTWTVKSSGTAANLNAFYSAFFEFNQLINNVAVGDGGIIIRSIDQGNSWIAENSTTNNNLNSILGNGENMYVAGNNGTILNYTLGYGYYSNIFIDANNIKAYYFNNGLFHFRGDPYYNGLEWPKGSNLNTVFCAGLWLAAKVQDSIRVALSYYDSVYYPGAINYYNQIPIGKNDPQYRIYKISPVYPNGGDGFDSWSIWPIQQGAKWIDVNHNNVYDPPIDRPLMKGDQNTFCSFTDGYPESHQNHAGMTGTLNSEIHMYTYASVNQQCADIQFMEWEIINKKNLNWDSLMIAIWSDVDIGYASDDAIGCDSLLNLAFAYNFDNEDEGYYGVSPPAVGYVIYGVSRHSTHNADFINNMVKNSNEPQYYLEAFNLMKGLKKDGSLWLNPITNKITKYPLSGNPENHTGWLESIGGDKRLFLGSFIGSVVPLDTINFKAAVIVKRGTSNLNSVTQIVNCINQGVIGLNEHGIYREIPRRYYLYQNYPNPFNPKTKIKFEMSEEANINLVIYDIQGRVVKFLIDNKKTDAGYHEIEFDGTNFASGVYFYKIFSSKFSKTHKMVLLK